MTPENFDANNPNSNYGDTYFTYDDFSGMTAEEVQSILQLPNTSRGYIKFSTLQIIDDINTPTTNWNRTDIPEPLTISYPESWLIGGKVLGNLFKSSSYIDPNKYRHIFGKKAHNLSKFILVSSRMNKVHIGLYQERPGNTRIKTQKAIVMCMSSPHV